MISRCLFCGEDASHPYHLLRCGRPSHTVAVSGLPRLMSGLTEETYETSVASAVSTDDTKETQRALVLATIRAAGGRGVTDDELQEQLGLDGSSERPRRWELWKRDEIRIARDATGHAIKRVTRTNRQAVVWVAAPLRRGLVVEVA